MDKFETVTSVVAPFPDSDVDTDLIIPAQYLTSTSRAGYGENVFKRLREDPKFFMNDSRYAGAEVLCVGENFGCGSSREHAVWALRGAGFKVIIGTTFADIFTGNSGKNGLLLVKLPEATVQSLLAQAAAAPVKVTVDLSRQVVTLPDGASISFEYDQFRKTCLLDGLEDVDYLLRHRAAIEAHFSKRNVVTI